ncbi:MAG: hypothetical protein J6S91_12045 [Treponema sp.]|nr:hypothetical protein [Treponema sp.]
MKKGFLYAVFYITMTLVMFGTVSCTPTTDNISGGSGNSFDSTDMAGIVLTNGSWFSITEWYAIDEDSGAVYQYTGGTIAAGANSQVMLVPGNRNYWFRYKKSNDSSLKYTQTVFLETGTTLQIAVE